MRVSFVKPSASPSCLLIRDSSTVCLGILGLACLNFCCRAWEVGKGMGEPGPACDVLWEQCHISASRTSPGPSATLWHSAAWEPPHHQMLSLVSNSHGLPIYIFLLLLFAFIFFLWSVENLTRSVQEAFCCCSLQNCIVKVSERRNVM